MIGGNYENIEKAIETSSLVSPEMKDKMNVWRSMYEDKAPWLCDNVTSLNISSFVTKEIALLTTLEMKSKITSEGSPNAKLEEYANRQYERLLRSLRTKLEEAQAVGGMIIKPYVNHRDGEIYFSFSMQDEFIPFAFDGNGKVSDALFFDKFVENGNYYTRTERHKTLDDGSIEIEHRAFVSSNNSFLGVEIPLSDVQKWASINPKSIVKGSGGELFGFYKVPIANNIDCNCPLGVSVFAKAEKIIEDADEQYSRLKWEYEGGELAIDVAPEVLLPVNKKKPNEFQMPKLNKRLFRAVDLGTSTNYDVFNPAFRDSSLLSGLNNILRNVERLVGLASGTMSDVDNVARTATELNIMRVRTASTIIDNQKALEEALSDVIRTIGVYINIYGLAPSGDIKGTFEWGDSITTDSLTEYNQKRDLVDAGIMSKAEFRSWYMGEDIETAEGKVNEISSLEANLTNLLGV